jgi:hypothetical protein
MGPLLASRGDHIHMPMQQQWRSIATSRQSRNQVWSVWMTAKENGLESGCNQQLINIGNALGFIAWWIGSIETDEVLQ